MRRVYDRSTNSYLVPEDDLQRCHDQREAAEALASAARADLFRLRLRVTALESAYADLSRAVGAAFAPFGQVLTLASRPVPQEMPAPVTPPPPPRTRAECLDFGDDV